MWVAELSDSLWHREHLFELVSEFNLERHGKMKDKGFTLKHNSGFLFSLI